MMTVTLYDCMQLNSDCIMAGSPTCDFLITNNHVNDHDTSRCFYHCITATCVAAIVCRCLHHIRPCRVHCSYLRQTVNETLRWAVISPIAGRVQDVDTVLAGHVIPAGVSSFHSRSDNNNYRCINRISLQL